MAGKLRNRSGQAFRQFGQDLRNAELPNPKLVVLYPLVAAGFVALLIFHAVSGSPHSPHSPTSNSPAPTSPNRTTPPSPDVAVPTEQGSTLEVPRAALNAIDLASGLPTGTVTGLLVVDHPASGRSITCVVTTANASGQATQRFFTVTERSGGVWSQSGG